MLDAYTVRKAVPRILLAVIGINLSIYVCVAALDLTTIAGKGIGQLLNEAFIPGGEIKVSGEALDLNVTSGVATAGALALLAKGIAAAGSQALIASLFPLLLIVGLIALAVFFTLVVRQGLLIFLTVLSPIAMACFVLPGTEKYFQKWFDLFLKTLMMYPIIASIFAMSNVMASIILGDSGGVASFATPATIVNSPLFAQASSADSDAVSVLKLFTGIIVIYAPLALIPFSFKLAGGALGAVFNAAERASAGKRAGLQKGRTSRLDEARARNMAKTLGNGRFNRNNVFARGANRALQTGALMGQGNLSRSSLRAARSATMSSLHGKAMEDEAVKAVIGNDDLLHAASHGNQTEASAREHLANLGQTGSELDDNVASIMLAKRRVGTSTFNQIAAVQNAGTGTGYADGPAQMLEAINQAAGGDRALAARMLAGARGNAERARRVDLHGAGFGAQAAEMGALAEGRTTADAVNETLTDQVLEAKSAGEIGTARHGALVNMEGAINRRIARATAGVNQARTAISVGGATDANRQALAVAEREQKRVMASTASLLDVAGSASSENAELIGGVMGQNVESEEWVNVAQRDSRGAVIIDRNTGQPLTTRQRSGRTTVDTVGNAIENLRTDEVFGQFRREYGRAQDADAARRAAEGGAPPPPEA